MRTALLALGGIEFFLFLVFVFGAGSMDDETRHGGYALGYLIGLAMAIIVYAG